MKLSIHENFYYITQDVDGLYYFGNAPICRIRLKGGAVHTEGSYEYRDIEEVDIHVKKDDVSTEPYLLPLKRGQFTKSFEEYVLILNYITNQTKGEKK